MVCSNLHEKSSWIVWCIVICKVDCVVCSNLQEKSSKRIGMYRTAELTTHQNLTALASNLNHPSTRFRPGKTCRRAVQRGWEGPRSGPSRAPIDSGTCRPQASRRWHSRSTSAKSAKFFEVQHAFQQQGAIYKLFQGGMMELCCSGCLALQARTPLPLTLPSCTCALCSECCSWRASVPRRGSSAGAKQVPEQ